MSDILSRLSSALAGRYSVTRELGAGGMATVYLARDVKHERDVAIKVLHPDLGAALGAERFLSEIRTTARLQHAHILPLLDSGDADGLLYYVMPVVTGESLRVRLDRERQLPIPEAVRIAREVASALDYAHRQGVIHRDIKPENILLHEGQALVADFGISLAVQTAGGQRMTQTGLSLGTPQYMSPEQAMGEKVIDARSDIYALGTVTYEMLVGEPPFSGPNVQAIVAKLLSERPTPPHTVRDTIPLSVEQAVLTALAKLPADRFATAAEYSQALGDPAFASLSLTRAAVAPPAVRSGAPRRMYWAAAIAAGIALGATLAIWLRPSATLPLDRERIMLWRSQFPDIVAPGALFVGSRAAIAPDGSSIVYVDSIAEGYCLMRKLRDSSDGVPIAGTLGAVSPFFSPDGKWVGYLTRDGKVRKASLAGGGSVTLAENLTGFYFSGAWLSDGTIVYSTGRRTVARIPSDGGTPVFIEGLPPTGNILGLWPLPDSRGFLFTGCSNNCAIESSVSVYDLKQGTTHALVEGATGSWYSPTGHLLYTGRDGGLYAQPFDLRTLELRSGAVSVIEDVTPSNFTISASGAALYMLAPRGGAGSELVWVTRDGKAESFDWLWRGRFEYPSLSPDGRSLVVSVRDRTTDLWIRRADGTRQRLTNDGVANWRASWMPDGKSFAYASIMREKAQDSSVALLARADGSGKRTQLVDHPFGIWEVEISRDGRWLVFRADEERGDGHLRARRLSGDSTVVPLVVEKWSTLGIALSPDSRWLAYTSNEAAGRYEVYVASFPDMSSKRIVSRGGGTEPRWSRSGRELFFESGGQLMVVSVPPGPAFEPSNPKALFSLAGYRRARNHQQYDVAPDGRFLMIRDSDASNGSAIYVENWLTELEGKLKGLSQKSEGERRQ